MRAALATGLFVWLGCDTGSIELEPEPLWGSVLVETVTIGVPAPEPFTIELIRDEILIDSWTAHDHDGRDLHTFEQVVAGTYQMQIIDIARDRGCFAATPPYRPAVVVSPDEEVLVQFAVRCPDPT